MQQQRELELMNSFREQFGRDWLQYRNHLETCGIPVLATSKTPALSTLPPDTLSPETVPGPPPPQKESPQEVAEEVSVGPEPQDNGEMEKQGKEEEEQEQKQKEVEGELLVAAGVVCLGEEGKPRHGVLTPCGWRASPQEGRVLVLFHPYRVPLSWFLLSGALSPHIGVSPGGASGCEGQRVLSPGHFWPPV